MDGVGAAVVGTSELPGYFPMLCSLNQQGSLGIKIDTETKPADVRAFALCDRPLCRSSAGHLAINLLDSWNDDITELCRGFEKCPYHRDRAFAINDKRGSSACAFNVRDPMHRSLTPRPSSLDCDEGMSTTGDATVECQPGASTSAAQVVANIPEQLLAEGGRVGQDTVEIRSCVATKSGGSWCVPSDVFAVARQCDECDTEQGQDGHDAGSSDEFGSGADECGRKQRPVPAQSRAKLRERHGE